VVAAEGGFLSEGGKGKRERPATRGAPQSGGAKRQGQAKKKKKKKEKKKKEARPSFCWQKDESGALDDKQTKTKKGGRVGKKPRRRRHGWAMPMPRTKAKNNTHRRRFKDVWGTSRNITPGNGAYGQGTLPAPNMRKFGGQY